MKSTSIVILTAMATFALATLQADNIDPAEFVVADGFEVTVWELCTRKTVASTSNIRVDCC